MKNWIVDVDQHVTEPGDLWLSRLPSRYRDRVPRIVTDANGRDYWQLGIGGGTGESDLPHMKEGRKMWPVGHFAVAGWHEPWPEAPLNMDQVPKAAKDAGERLLYMDEMGIWATAIYPNVAGFGNEDFLSLRDSKLMLQCVRAYNDFLLDWISPDPRRFIPIMAIPYWDVEQSVVEIERCAKIGFRGINFTGTPQSLGLPLLGDAHWDPIWSAAEDTGLPISFHIGGGSFDDGITMERVATHGVGPSVARAQVSMYMDNGLKLIDLLLSGLLPRHPNVKFVSVESGVGWIPFMLEALDHDFRFNNVQAERSIFKLLPSEYFSKHIYGCYFFEEKYLDETISQLGASNLLFETDYPHPSCIYGNVREKALAGLKNQPREVRDRILWKNAAELYQVEMP